MKSVLLTIFRIPWSLIMGPVFALVFTVWHCIIGPLLGQVHIGKQPCPSKKVWWYRYITGVIMSPLYLVFFIFLFTVCGMLGTPPFII